MGLWKRLTGAEKGGGESPREWRAVTETLEGKRGLKFSIVAASGALPYSEVVNLWRGSDRFRDFFNGLLAEAPFAAFRWETPPVTDATAGRLFEFVLWNSPGLDAAVPDFSSFAAPVRAGNPEASVLAFPNLGGDAVMVVPRPLGPHNAYGHLAAFVRRASGEQRHALWMAVGEAMTNRIGTRPVWLSTAGAGVPWLHVRLDSTPKYYGHAPYARLPGAAG